MVASQLNDYISSKGLENIRQSAYKLGHSTETALLSIENDVHLTLARGEATTVVLLDQSAVFDKIDHGTLLGCLSSCFGVCDVVLDWFKSFLYVPLYNELRLALFCLMQRSFCLAWPCPWSNTLFLIYYSPQQSHL